MIAVVRVFSSSQKCSKMESRPLIPDQEMKLSLVFSDEVQGQAEEEEPTLEPVLVQYS